MRTVRQERKALRAERKADWKRELPSYYHTTTTNTSAAGIVYQQTTVNKAVLRDANKLRVNLGTLYGSWVLSKLLGKDGLL